MSPLIINAYQLASQNYDSSINRNGYNFIWIVFQLSSPSSTQNMIMRGFVLRREGVRNIPKQRRLNQTLQNSWYISSRFPFHSS